jgi:hypothetical protein
MDLIYFMLLLLVVVVGYLAANQESDEAEVVMLPDFSLPVMDLEIPFEFPYDFVKYARPTPPKLVLSENMESVMIEVRSALLKSSEPVEIRPEAQFAAIAE